MEHKLTGVELLVFRLDSSLCVTAPLHCVSKQAVSKAKLLKFICAVSLFTPVLCRVQDGYFSPATREHMRA